MKVPKSCYVADTARIIGSVELGEDCVVLFGAVVLIISIQLRGDGGVIEVGARTNIQDNATLHPDPVFPVIVGDDVSIGHGVVPPHT